MINKKIALSLLSIILLTLLLSTPKKVHSQTPHIVISEVQIAGATAADEFVELYNPTNTPIDLSGYRLAKKTSTGTQSNLMTSMSGIVPAYGYFLVTPQIGYTGTTAADLLYSTSNSIAANNTVILFSDAGTTIVDKVGMGTAVDSETQTTTSPIGNTSIERKANINSTQQTMHVGGIDAVNGNEYDTNNNQTDFVDRQLPQPQNSSSQTEQPLVISPTPTITASPTLAPTPTTTPTNIPTIIPTQTPSPTPSPTEIPTPSSTISPTDTPSPTPLPTEEPTSTPTLIPSPTQTPIPTPTATATPLPTPTQTPKTNSVFTCTNPYIPSFVYAKLMLLMPWKFKCS